MTLKTITLLVPSGNDAAIAIAESVGAALRSSGTASGDSDVKAFVAQMNATAQNSVARTRFTRTRMASTSTNTVATPAFPAADQAKVVAYAMTNQTFRSVVGGGSTTITVKRGGSSADVFLETDGFFDINDTIGVKTGYTEKAGASFAPSAKTGRSCTPSYWDRRPESQRFFDADELVSGYFEHRRSPISLPICDQNADGRRFRALGGSSGA